MATHTMTALGLLAELMDATPTKDPQTKSDDTVTLLLGSVNKIAAPESERIDSAIFAINCDSCRAW
jgi:hypothetical protein